MMRGNGIDDEHNTSAGDGICSCSASIHRRRRMDAIDDEHNTSSGDGVLYNEAYIGRERWMQSMSGSHALLSTMKRFECRTGACR